MSITIHQLNELRAKCESIRKQQMWACLKPDGTWEIQEGNGGDIVNVDTDEQLLSLLNSRAVPPSPKTVLIEVPFEWAAWRADKGTGMPECKAVVDAACKAAIQPYMPLQPMSYRGQPIA